LKLEKTIVHYATEEIKKNNEGKDLPNKTKKSSCPSCELEEFKKTDYIHKEII
jgi:CRISPR/Cas system-associated exonuclease Cas4 (RecB family)